jgi:heme/copper-type cytochrome/quinol oxidase subunit 2
MIHTLASLLFWVAAGCILAAHLAMLRGLWTAQSPSQPTRHGARPGVRSDILWTLVPALLLGVVLVFTWKAIPPERAAEVGPGIEVTAR